MTTKERIKQEVRILNLTDPMLGETQLQLMSKIFNLLNQYGKEVAEKVRHEAIEEVKTYFQTPYMKEGELVSNIQKIQIEDIE